MTMMDDGGDDDDHDDLRPTGAGMATLRLVGEEGAAD